jgi:hypothetical protein
MLKLSTMGLLSIFGGLLVLGFQVLSSLMEREGPETLSIEVLLDQKYIGWMVDASWFGLEKIAIYVVTMPLYILLIAIGVLLLLAVFFFSK